MAVATVTANGFKNNSAPSAVGMNGPISYMPSVTGNKGQCTIVISGSAHAPANGTYRRNIHDMLPGEVLVGNGGSMVAIDVATIGACTIKLVVSGKFTGSFYISDSTLEFSLEGAGHAEYEKTSDGWTNN